MPTLGQDCHITLTHPAVNNGQPSGWTLDAASRLRPEGILLTRSNITGQGLVIWIYFDVLLADRLLHPDGSLHAGSRLEDYHLLMEYLGQREGLALATSVGVFVNLGAVGFTAHEYHSPGRSLVKACLTNSGVYFPPVDPAILTLSIWDGSLTWETSYWH